jgi:hypothetical protein
MSHSKYKKQYCKDVVDFMAKGMSLTSFCAEIHTHRDTVYEWRKKYPEFDKACEIGFDMGQKFFESLMSNAALGILPENLKRMGSTGINMTAVIFALKTRFHRDYSEKQKIEHSGNVSTTINFIEK